MKKLLLLLIALLLLSLGLFAQAPEMFKYQAHIMDDKGSVVNNTTIGLQLSIYQNGLNGNLVYQEVYTVTTNKSGLVNLEIGMGNATTGMFSEINWGTGPYFLETAVDLKGGASYVSMGASQLLSVPYALHAKKVGSIEGNEDEILELVEGGHSHTLGQVLTEGNDAEDLQIQNLTNPVNPQDAATKAYVDLIMKVMENNGLSVVDFESDKQLASKNCVIQFTDLSNINATSWLWNFGDGNTSSDQNPAHVFQEDGVYTVSLTATNNITDITKTRTDYIEVISTIQKRLDCGETPFQIYQSDNNLLESLYGKYYQGGLIYFLNINDGTGFVAAPTDQEDVIRWGGGAPSGLYINLYKGLSNTTRILSWYNWNSYDNAAGRCYKYTRDGYTDWFLPSSNELSLMYNNLHKNGYGNFNSTPGTNEYWSSYGREIGYYHYGYYVRFDDTGILSRERTSFQKRVRASRMF